MIWTQRKTKYVLLFSILFLLGFLYGLLIPKAEAWLLVKIEELTKNHTPLSVFAKKINLRLAPLSVEISDLRLIPQKGFENYAMPTMVDRVSVDVDLISLLRGLVRIDEVRIEGSLIQITLPQRKHDEEEIKLDLSQILGQIPLNYLNIKNLRLEIEDPTTQSAASFSIPSLKVHLENPFVSVSTSQLNVRFKKILGEPFEDQMKLSTSFALSNRKLILSDFKLTTRDSYILTSGTLKVDLPNKKVLGFGGQTRIYTRLEKLTENPLLRRWVKTQVPHAEGLVRLAFTADGDDFRSTKWIGDLHATDLKIDQYTIGKVNSRWQFKQNEFTVSQLQLFNRSLEAVAPHFTINTNSPYKFSTQVHVKKSELSDVLKSINLSVPIYLEVDTETSCNGQIKPLQVKCVVPHLDAQKLHVWSNAASSSVKNTIVKVDKAQVQGQLNISTESIDFTSKVGIGEDSEGSVDGTIHFSKGFHISYQSNQLDLSDVKDLAQLGLKGVGQLEGTVEGDTQYATFSFKESFDKSEIFGFKIGKHQGSISYSSGKLQIESLSGALQNSLYDGRIQVDLSRGQLAAQLNFPSLDLQDVQFAVEQNLKIPFAITGAGKATAEISGPFALNKMNLRLNSQIFKGSIAEEKFDQASIQLRANQGHLVSETFEIRKSTSVANLSLEIKPTGDVEGHAKVNRLLLEETNFIQKQNYKISGFADIDLLLSGHLKRPLILANGKIYQTRLTDRPFPDTDFILRLLPEKMKLESTFFGGAVTLAVDHPYSAKLKSKITLQTKDWDFTQIMSSLDQSLALKSFEGSLTSDANIEFDRENFWNSKIDVQLAKLVFNRGNLFLKLNQPAEIHFADQRLDLKNLKLDGDGNYIHFTPHALNRAPIDFQINSKINLSLLSIFTPFLEEIDGIASFALNLQADPKKWSLLGSAYLDKAYVKLYDFPHPFEDARVDLLFNERKILINSIRGFLGGGKVLGDGQIDFISADSIPIRLDAHVENANLNFPPQYQTSGSARISINGSQLPYTLSGQYRIFRGLISSEFGSGSESSVPKSKRRYFLPEVLGKKQVAPLLLDLDIETMNPLRIQNSLIDGRLNAKMSVQGVPQNPKLQGSVSLEQYTKLIFRDRRFDTQTATVRFDGSQPIDPVLFINATTRLLSYDITLLVQGKASKPEIVLNSQPSLPQQDLISLLALGVTTQQNSSTVNSSQQQRQSTYQIGAAVLSNNPLGKEIKNRFGWEMQIAPSFDEENNVAVPKVTFSKQISSRIGATASYERGKQPRTDVKLRYLVNQQIYLVGSFTSNPLEEATQQNRNQLRNTNIFGLDLEFKREFK